MSTIRPILYTGAMVRALLCGRKTQTRRVMKPQPEPHPDMPSKHWWPAKAFQSMVGIEDELQYYTGMAGDCCPHGDKCERLWVRETWGVVSNDWDDDGNMVDWIPDRPATEIHELPFGQGYYSGHVIYAADGAYEWAADDDGGGGPRSAWHPSIHMPRAASRITLEITGVSVERLQAIREADARAEGVTIEDRHMGGYCAGEFLPPAIRAYREVWEQINGPGSWEANPWVWCIDFRQVPP